MRSSRSRNRSRPPPQFHRRVLVYCSSTFSAFDSSKPRSTGKLTFDSADFEHAGTIPEVAQLLLRPFFTDSTLLEDLEQVLAETFSFPIPATALPGADGHASLLANRRLRETVGWQPRTSWRDHLDA